MDVPRAEPGPKDRQTLPIAHRPSVYEVRMDHDHADHGAEIDVGAEYLCRADRNQDRQERERCIGKHVEQREQVRVRHGGERLCQASEQSAQKTGRHDRGDDRDENVADGLDRSFEPGRLVRRRRFDVVLGRRVYAGKLNEFVIHLVDRTGADDDLQLTCRLKHALDNVHIFEDGLVDLGVVRDHQTQTGRAVRGADNVLFAADRAQDLRRTFFVIHAYISFFWF